MNCFLRTCLLLLLAAVLPAFSQPLPFRHAMELTAARAASSPAAAENMRAQAAVREARNMFLPQLVVGSGLGKSFGFPLTIEGAAPSIFNVNYQSYVFNPSQREYIRSAQAAANATGASLQDQRDALLLEAATDYVQLDTITLRLQVLRKQQQQAGQLESVVNARVSAGIAPQMDLIRAQLQSARVRLSLAQANSAADALRERLGQLTGLPAAEIETVTDSIPNIPDPSQQPDLVPTALRVSPALKMADAEAASKLLAAKAEHKMRYPAIDAVAQYGVFAKYNNYDLYFTRFQRNNATVGVAIRFPLLNFAGTAHAEAADAEAVKAQRQANNTRDQVANDTRRLGNSIEQLTASQEVSKLEWQLAQGQEEAVRARIEEHAPAAPQGASGQAAAASPSDLDQAQLETSDRYGSYLDASFELQKARLELLRATGELEKWALGAP